MCHNFLCSHSIWYGVSSVFINTLQDKLRLLWGQEIILIWKGRDQKPRHHSRRQGDEPFDDLKQAWCWVKNCANRSFNTPTKIHFQPASFPFPSRRVQPYARIGPIPAAIKAIKYRAAMLNARSMMRAGCRTVHWHTAIEPRGVYTCEMYRLILKIAERIRYIPSCYDKHDWREERSLAFIRSTHAAGTGDDC